MLKASPVDSEPEGGWMLDTTVGTEAQVADQKLWQEQGCEYEAGCDPLEYRTLFDNKGFIFNIVQTKSGVQDTLKVSRPTTLDVSPSKEQLAKLLNPSSPGHRQLAAVLRAPLPSPWDSPHIALLHCPEEDPSNAERELAAPRGRFLRTATDLHSRLLDLDSETSRLLYEGFRLRHGFQEMLTNTEYLLSQARQLQQELQDVLYLNDLLWMLRGRMERVSRRRWPFLVAHIDVYGEGAGHNIHQSFKIYYEDLNDEQSQE